MALALQDIVEANSRPATVRPDMKALGACSSGYFRFRNNLALMIEAVCVEAAYHKILDVELAIKILDPAKRSNDPTSVAMFLREARVAASIKHSNIINTFEENAVSLSNKIYKMKKDLDIDWNELRVSMRRSIVKDKLNNIRS